MAAADLLLQRLDLLLDELEDRPTANADHVLVVSSAEGRLVEGLASAHVVAPEQAGLHHVRQRPVNGGSRDLGSVTLERDQQLVGVEVAEVPECVLDDYAALGRYAQATLAQPSLEVALQACHPIPRN